MRSTRGICYGSTLNLKRPALTNRSRRQPDAELPQNDEPPKWRLTFLSSRRSPPLLLPILAVPVHTSDPKAGFWPPGPSIVRFGFRRGRIRCMSASWSHPSRWLQREGGWSDAAASSVLGDPNFSRSRFRVPRSPSTKPWLHQINPSNRAALSINAILHMAPAGRRL